jgi:hypothetical protein
MNSLPPSIKNKINELNNKVRKLENTRGGVRANRPGQRRLMPSDVEKIRQARARRPPRAQEKSGLSLSDYVNMVADPCHSTLFPGIYGSSEGMSARSKSSFTIPSAPTAQPGADVYTAGYCLWAPDYSSGVAEDVQSDPVARRITSNCYFWSTDDPSKAPTNNNNYPFGYGLSGTTANTIVDPAANLVTSNLVADARVTGACMQMTYFGKMLEAAGEIGYISNLPIEDLIAGGDTGGVPGPVTVDELFQYTTQKQRLGTDTLETVYQLNPSTSHLFRNQTDSVLQTTSATDATSIESSTVSATPPRLFGFVWRHTQPGAGITVDLTKSIEWRPEVSSGLPQVPLETYGPSMVPTVNRVIDTAEKQTGRQIWQRKMSTDGAHGGLAKQALKFFSDGGYGSKLVNAAISFGGQKLMGAAMKDLPRIAGPQMLRLAL